MSDGQIAVQIGEIRRLFWQQSWRQALDRCQAIEDGPPIDEQAVAELRELRQCIESGERAELSIRQALDSVEQALAEPSPNYGALRARLQQAIDLGNRYYIQRYHGRLLSRMEDVRRREDIYARYEADRKLFRQALDAGNHERALEIAQRLLDDALMSQQPAMADSAQKWIEEIGDKVKIDHLANSIFSALEREDFAWACDLFKRLPFLAQRYDELASLVEDAERTIVRIEQDLEEARARWAENKLAETEQILGDLQRRHKKNRMWRPLWRQFYNEQAYQAYGKGDEAVTGGDYIKAGQQYTRAESAFSKLLNVFEDDPTLAQSKERAGACRSVCEILAEAADARDRGDLPIARAACSRALRYIQGSASHVQEAVRMLQRRATEFIELLDALDQALEELKAAEAAPADGDTQKVLRRLDHVLALGPDLPRNVYRRAENLRDRTQARHEQAQIHVQNAAKAADPDEAAESYRQAWVLEQTPELQQEIVQFMLSSAAGESDYDRKRIWLEGALLIDPQSERANSEMIRSSKQPLFDRAFVPVHVHLEALETQPEPPSLEIKEVDENLAALAEEFKTVDELLAAITQDQARLENLKRCVKETHDAIAKSSQHKGHGRWEEAVAVLRTAADKLALPSQSRRLHTMADSLQEQWGEATQLYKQAGDLYAQALVAHQGAADSQEYGAALPLIGKSQERLRAAHSKVENLPPREWKRLDEDLQAFERRARAIQSAWEASLDPNQPLARLVKDLQAQNPDNRDPVMNRLIEQLKQRAVAECITNADNAEAEDQEELAIEELRTAMDLGGDQPGLRTRLDTLAQRQARRQRMVQLQVEIQNSLQRRGGLRTASRRQTELLDLMVKDTGQSTWIEAVDRLLAAIPQDVEGQLLVAAEKHRDTGLDVGQELTRARDEYTQALRNAENELDRLRQLAHGQGGAGYKVWQEGDKWLYYKNQLCLYNMATSYAALGDLVQSARNWERLRDEANADATEYTQWEDEFHQACDRIVKDIEDSANKRLTEAEVAVEAGLYEDAEKSLQEIITRFYERAENELPVLRPRLNEVGTPLGEIRLDVNRRLLGTRRLVQIDARLKAVVGQVKADLNSARAATAAADKAREAIYRPNANREEAEKQVDDQLDLMQQSLHEALARIEGAALDDPDQVCKHQWAQLDKLAEQVRAYRAEQENAQACRVLREAENQMQSICSDEDYRDIQLRLRKVNTDTLSADDKDRHKKLLDKLQQQAGLPALLRLADEALKKEDFTKALQHYENALNIRTDLGRDATFCQKMTDARTGAQSLTTIDILMTQAIDCEPAAAIKLLQQAYNKAEQLQAESQMKSIERRIDQAKAREACSLAEKALQSYQDLEAKRKAEMAIKHANRCGDQSIHVEASQILNELEERYKTVVSVVNQARALLEDCLWQDARDLLRPLDANDPLVRPVLDRAEAGYYAVQKAEREIQTFVDAGRFGEAFSRLTQARIGLAVSDRDARRLHDSIQSVQDGMSDFTLRIDALVQRITSADPLRPADVEKAIREAKELANDTRIVKGLRDEAMQLVHCLDQLVKALDKTSRAVSRSEQLRPDWTAILTTLQDVHETIPFRWDGQEYQIKHHAAEAVKQRRREAFASQLVSWKTQLETLDSLPKQALKDLKARCEAAERYTSNPDEIGQLEKIRAQVDLSLEQKLTEELCSQWEAKVEDARHLWTTREVGQALTTIQEIQKSIRDYKAQSQYPQTLPKMTDVWEKAVRLGNDIQAQSDKNLEQVLQRAQVAVGESAETIVASEQECERLLQDPHLSKLNSSRLEAACAELSRAKADLKDAEGKLAEARSDIKLRKYSQAVATLRSSHTCPHPLRVQWEALTRVVLELDRATQLLEGDTDLMANVSSLNAQLRTYEEALQRCQDLDETWPSALTSEVWMHDLHAEIRLLTLRICRRLCDTVERLAALALNVSNPNEAERLVTMARDEGWVTEDYQDRMADLDHEIKIVRVMVSVENLLIAPGGDAQEASVELGHLLARAHTADSMRRERAAALQRLVEIRTLLKQEQVDLAEQYVNDTRLMDLYPTLFSTISREVNLAVKDRAIVKGLIAQADRLIYAPPGADFGDVSNWLPELKRRADEGHPILKAKLQAVHDHTAQELKVARERGDYARLRALNSLAHTLNLNEPDVPGLENERKQHLQEELDQARQAMEVWAPEMAEGHIEMAKRLSEQDSGEAQELARRLKEIRRTCVEVDRLLSEAEVFIQRRDYKPAAVSYKQASQLAPRRATVHSFEKVQHEALWHMFDAGARSDDFGQALEIAGNALELGFRTGEWQEAKRDLERRRNQRVAELIARAAGPGYIAGTPEQIWQGLLGDPDANLDALQRDLETALTWNSASTAIGQLLIEVKKRLKGVGDIRLDAHNGWLALEQGNYQLAAEHFSSAQTRLGREHPEITRWQRLTHLALESARLLATAVIDVESQAGGRFQVVCPGWEKIVELLSAATTIFADPKRSALLGVEGETAQKRQHEQAVARHRLAVNISQDMTVMQRYYDEEKWQPGALHLFEANENLKKLREQIYIGTVPLPPVVESSSIIEVPQETGDVAGWQPDLTHDIYSEPDEDSAVEPEVTPSHVWTEVSEPDTTPEREQLNEPTFDSQPSASMETVPEKPRWTSLTGVDAPEADAEFQDEPARVPVPPMFQIAEQTWPLDQDIQSPTGTGDSTPVPEPEPITLDPDPAPIQPVPPTENQMGDFI